MSNRTNFWKERSKIGFEISGLKCDYCDYRDDSVPFSDYPKSIGRTCPKCGNILLTKKEYDDCIKLYVKIDQLESVLNILKWFNPINYYRYFFGIKNKVYTLKKDYPNRTIE